MGSHLVRSHPSFLSFLAGPHASFPPGSLASTIYQLFLGSDTSSSTFSNLKTIHGMMPYFMLRGVLKISNPVAMVRGVLDLFLARPFGSTSLLQKMFSSGLADEARELREDAEMVARKIGDERMVQKVQNFVDASKDIQDIFRAEAGPSPPPRFVWVIAGS